MEFTDSSATCAVHLVTVSINKIEHVLRLLPINVGTTKNKKRVMNNNKNREADLIANCKHVTRVKREEDRNKTTDLSTC